MYMFVPSFTSSVTSPLPFFLSSPSFLSSTPLPPLLPPPLLLLPYCRRKTANSLPLVSYRSRLSYGKYRLVLATNRFSVRLSEYCIHMCQCSQIISVPQQDMINARCQVVHLQYTPQGHWRGLHSVNVSCMGVFSE